MNIPAARGRGGHNWKYLGKSPAGFSLELCAKSQIRKLKKRTGEMHVNLTWKEYVLDDVVSPKSSIESEPVLKWNSGRVVEFPDNAHAISSKIRFFDGTEIALTGSYSNEYIDVLWNAGTKQLQINTKKPSSIEEIY